MGMGLHQKGVTYTYLNMFLIWYSSPSHQTNFWKFRRNLFDTTDEVKLLLARTADKSMLDVIPTWLLKKLTNSLSPSIAEFANITFKTGVLPTEFNTAQVTPILKKEGLPTDDSASYHSISNLNTILSILERLELARISSHLSKR